MLSAQKTDTMGDVFGQIMPTLTGLLPVIDADCRPSCGLFYNVVMAVRYMLSWVACMGSVYTGGQLYTNPAAGARLHRGRRALPMVGPQVSSAYTLIALEQWCKGHMSNWLLTINP